MKSARNTNVCFLPAPKGTDSTSRDRPEGSQPSVVMLHKPMGRQPIKSPQAPVSATMARCLQSTSLPTIPVTKKNIPSVMPIYGKTTPLNSILSHRKMSAFSSSSMETALFMIKKTTSWGGRLPAPTAKSNLAKTAGKQSSRFPLLPSASLTVFGKPILPLRNASEARPTTTGGAISSLTTASLQRANCVFSIRPIRRAHPGRRPRYRQSGFARKRGQWRGSSR